ncbi:hypothetical protein PAXRUDRAFT_116233, partial [Paxillus rubicundulus Ve08.2h10]
VLNTYDHDVIQNSSKSKNKADNIAFSADLKKGKDPREKFSGTCFNCGWTGHRKESCWEEGRGRAGKAPKGWKPKGKKDASAKDSKAKANTAASSESQPDAVWLAEDTDEGHDELQATSALSYATLA